MGSNAIVVLLVFAIMPVILGVFQKYFSTKQIEEDKQFNIQELTVKFKKWDIFNQLFGMILMAASAYIWYQALVFLSNQHNQELIARSSFFVPPSIGFWILTAMFLGIACGAVLAFMSLGFLLGNDFGLYVRYYNLKYGFDAYNLLKPLLIFVSAVGFMVAILGFNMYSGFTSSEIIIGHFGFGAARYSYNDVAAVKYIMKFKAPNGSIKDKPHIVINFNDGKKWNSRNRGYNSIYKNEALAELVANKSGKPMERIEFDR